MVLFASEQFLRYDTTLMKHVGKTVVAWITCIFNSQMCFAVGTPSVNELHLLLRLLQKHIPQMNVFSTQHPLCSVNQVVVEDNSVAIRINSHIQPQLLAATCNLLVKTRVIPGKSPNGWTVDLSPSSNIVVP